MKKIIKFFKSLNTKNYKLMKLIVFAFAVLSFIQVFQDVLINLNNNNEIYINSFSVWDAFNHSMLMDFFAIISSILICYGSLKILCEKFRNGYLEASLLRQPYNIFIIKEFIQLYIKAYIPYFMLSFISFIMCLIIFPHQVLQQGILYGNLNFFNYGISNNYLAVIIYIIGLFFFTSFIVNISLLCIRKTKKFNLLAISTFLCINIINFLIGNISNLISQIISNNFILSILNQLNIYSLLAFEGNIIIAFIQNVVYFIISLIPVLMIYTKKESMFNYE